MVWNYGGLNMFFGLRFCISALRLWLVFAFSIFLVSCRTPSSADLALERFAYEQPQMGVPFRIVLYASNETQAAAAARAAFDRIAELNSIMSDYETDSELSELSRSSEEGSPEVPLSADLWNVLSRAQELARETAGAFDVTIGPCAALWRYARRQKEFPEAQRLENARAKVGFENLILNEQGRTARLTRFGMRLDLGAIAKGYAAEEALEILRQRGITRALVAASGDLALGDPPPAEEGWRIELIGYDNPDGPPSKGVLLSNCAVATSGDLYQRLELRGVRYSHILDPRTCVGLTNHALVTVVARDATTADSLATAMTVLEPAAALDLAARHRVAARIIRLENERPVVYRNHRFENLW